MPNRAKRIAVVGAGSIGGVTATFLAKAGWDVEVVCKHQATVDRLGSPGMHVFGIKGDETVSLKAVKDISDLSGLKDVVFISTKANDCLEAARDILPYLEEDSAVVSLQNGICEEAMARIVGPRRIVGCVVAWGATMHGAGEVEVTSSGEFVIGNLNGRPDERLFSLRDMLDTVMPTRVSENIMGELYSKLIINSCINSLGALTGLPLGKLLAIRKVRRIFVSLMKEMMAVADAMEIKVEPGGGGKLDYYGFIKGTGVSSEIRRHILIRVIGFKYRRIRSSSLQSLERGRKTEIDYLNGYIRDRGLELGVPTPLNETMVAMIKAIEAGVRKITPNNLDDPALQGF